MGSYVDGQPARMPWSATVWDAGSGSTAIVPRLGRKHARFWKGVILRSGRASACMTSSSVVTVVP